MMVGVERCLDWALTQLHPPPKCRKHRRGEYVSIPSGYSIGGGQQEPMNFCLSKHNAKIMGQVLDNTYVQRFARFVDRTSYPLSPFLPPTSFSGGTQVYFPQIHRLLTNLHHQLAGVNDPDLRQNFPGVSFAACHFNLGRARTELHNDLKNIFFAVCGVGAVGPYNYREGAHLILWELGIVVEFPPGCAFIFPSASISHANIPIGPDECRHSIAFFTAAGNLRYYHNGFMTDKEFKERASKEQRKAWDLYRKNLWKVGMDMLRESC